MKLMWLWGRARPRPYAQTQIIYYEIFVKSVFIVAHRLARTCGVMNWLLGYARPPASACRTCTFCSPTRFNLGARIGEEKFCVDAMRSRPKLVRVCPMGSLNPNSDSNFHDHMAPYCSDSHQQINCFPHYSLRLWPRVCVCVVEMSKRAQWRR